MSNFKFLMVISVFAGATNSCEAYKPPPEFVPEFEQIDNSIPKEKPSKVRLRSNFGYS